MKPVKSKIIENKKIKETKLLNAAFELFTSKDIQNVTISEIAKKAGVAKGTFYLYFKDKDQICDILISREASRIFLNAQEKLDENDIRNFEDSIIYLINQILNELESNKQVASFIQKNLSWGIFSDYVHKSYSNDELHIRKRFAELAEKNAYNYEDPNLVLFMIIDFVGSTCYSSIVKNEPLPIREYKPYLFDAIRAILQSQKKS